MSQGPYKRDGETVYATEPVEEPSSGDDGSGSDEPVYRDKEWLYYQYHILKKSDRAIAEDVGVAVSTIQRWRKKHDIETEDRAKAVSKACGGDEKLWNVDWLRDQYDNKQESPYKIANKVGVHVTTVYNALDRHGIDTHPHDEAVKLRDERKYGDEKYNDPNWLRYQYEERQKSSCEIAEENGWAANTVRRALNRHGITTRSKCTSALLRYKEENGVSSSNGRGFVSSDGIDASWRDLKDRKRGKSVPYRDHGWLQARIDKGLTLEEMAAECGVSKSTIQRWIDHHDIDKPRTQVTKRQADRTYRNHDWLQARIDDGLTHKEIAEECGAGRTTIYRWINRHDIDRNQPADN